MGALFLFAPSTVLAFSISPSTINVQDIYPANPVEKIITVGLQENIGDVEVTVTKEGDGARFLRLKEQKFTIASGTYSYKFPVIINAEGAGTEAYQAKLTFIASRGQIGDSVVSMRVGLKGGINFSVTNTVFRDIKIENITAKGLAGGSHIMLKMSLKNNGNQNEEIKGGKIEFFNQISGTLIPLGEQSLSFSQKLNAFSGKNIQFKAMLDRPLDRGVYLVKVALNTNDGRQVSTSTVSFSVGGGLLPTHERFYQFKTIIRVMVNYFNFIIGFIITNWPYFVVFLCVLVLVLWFDIKKRR